MAGGKLSPRQKMINMMYLVLTALLALQVSSEILEAFNSLRESLKTTAEGNISKNEDTKGAIIAKVDEEIGQGNKKNESVKDMATQVSTETMAIVKYIESLATDLEKIGQKDPQTGEISLKSEVELNYQYWMGMGGKEESNGGRGAGKAFELRNKLNGYIKWANDFIAKDNPGRESPVKFEEIAIDPKDDKAVAKTNPMKTKPWEYFTFHGKPLIADLAMIEKFKMDVTNVQTELLNYLKAKLGQVTFKIDSLVAVDAPFSQVVAAGMYFETKLYVAMSSKDVHPEFSGSGTITKDAGGNSAVMKLQAMGGFETGKNEKEQAYSARIKVPKADGSVAELKVEGKFKVRKPEVVITSASVQNLYWNCGNALNVDVPALGDLYNPVFNASESEVIPGTNKKQVTIVPKGKQCVLGVSSNTNGQLIKIDEIKYKVIKPPKPSIELLVNGKEYNGATPIPKKSDCVVRVKADNDFMNALPKDARYYINNVDLLSQRSLGAPSSVGKFSGEGVDGTKGIPVSLGNKLAQDSPGTKIYFKIDKVYRVNFKNQKLEEDFADRDLYIGAVIK